ncbi:hypothetical protein [Terrabacter sp. C0L_2]|uniref:hypothetical protein n=1 Tax=Terrabacter sp. C0L_2 TaxID=3108389 RepID=UPI002ED54893|nr:hypothetical protein U5C87_10435 [Terrabacter sp. C0L_2]
MVVDVAPRRVRRIGWKVFAFGLFLLGCLLAVLVLTLRPAPTADTPIRAVDLYVSAREQGDRDAMAIVLDGNAGLLARRLNEVDGRPVDVTDVNITRSDISDVMYTVTVTWTDAGHAVSIDRLIVSPREGGDPSAPLDWSVSVAP